MTMQTQFPTTTQSLLDEERLVVERAQHDTAAFGEIYERYYRRLYAYTYNRTHSPEDAEDIVSNTFLQAMEGLARYEWRNVPFGAWLFRIASNQIAMHYRRSGRTVELDELSLESSYDGPEEEAIRGSDAADLRSAVLQLKPDQRRVIELRYHQDLRNREIAGQMGRTEGAVKLLLHRATNNLRSSVQPLVA